MKIILPALFPAVLAAVIGLWGYDCAASLSGNLFADFSGSLLAFGRLAGILAAGGVLAQFLLISRAKWLEPLFGFDRLTRVHHALGLAIPAAVLAHPALLVLHHAGQEGVPFLEQALAMLRWDNAAAAGAGGLLIIAAVIISLPAIKRRLSYEAWHSSHLVLYAGFALAAEHQFDLGGDVNGNPWFARLWYALFVFALVNLAWGRLLRPLLLYRRHGFTVEKIVPETTEAESVWITGRVLAEFGAEAGQFALLRFWAPGFRGQAHPFSFSMSPDGLRLRFTIKKLGDFTAAVHNFLRPGTPVLIDGPLGAFTEKKCLGDKALLIAGGIGITPLRALAERLQALDKDCVLLYANRSQKDVVFRKELSDLEQKGNLKVFHVLSGDPDWRGEKGTVDAGLIRRLVPDFAERDAFLCGPPAMSAAVRSSLLELGVSGSRVHSELFSF